MITFNQVLGNNLISDVPIDIQHNIENLVTKVNMALVMYYNQNTIPINTIVDSGLRTMEEHLRIYVAKGITDQSKIPMKSHHLFGEAVDISDPFKDLQSWCLAHIKSLEEIGLWCESFISTLTWVHFQIKPPLSGKRFFIP
jgi:hypothetical protein